jgi:hypothetical protein
MFPVPVKDRREISKINALIPIAANPASRPITMAIMIRKVCSVSRSLSRRARIFREILLNSFCIDIPSV